METDNIFKNYPTTNVYQIIDVITLDDNQTALLVEVNFDGDINFAPDLQEYLLSCYMQMRLDNHLGFAFVKKGDANEDTGRISSIESKDPDDAAA